MNPSPSKFFFLILLCAASHISGVQAAELPKIRISADAPRFEAAAKPFVPFGINYYRPGTGWAPQVWKKFDAEATRRDFKLMKELGVNCVRVFLSYGSFASEPGVLDQTGLRKFDQFLAIAEEFEIYVHPTGLDHWEGTPNWAKVDRIADERTLQGLEGFWKAFAARYRDRNVIFAYDLRNEPEVAWDTPPMRAKWNFWLKKSHPTAGELRRALESSDPTLDHGKVTVPDPRNANERELLEYQRFREAIADEWTRRQVAAIKASDPEALVTVGLIQWSVPSLLPTLPHYSGFRPERQARLLDFLEVHFYPLERGAYEYKNEEDELRNLAYLEGIVREVARPGQPVVIGEFGWYGGGKPKFDKGRHPAASEEQQARWCRRVVQTTAGLVVGWLNWGFYDQPEATDVSELTGLVTADGKVKAWGTEFLTLSKEYSAKMIQRPPSQELPKLDWDRAVVSLEAGHKFRELYYQARKKDLQSLSAASIPTGTGAAQTAAHHNVRVSPRQTEELFANPGLANLP
jgi:sugar phosphate isomerase/epimerase